MRSSCPDRTYQATKVSRIGGQLERGCPHPREVKRCDTRHQSRRLPRRFGGDSQSVVRFPAGARSVPGLEKADDAGGIKWAFADQTLGWTTNHRSADCQSAVSPTGSRQPVEPSQPRVPWRNPQVANLRYSRLPVCATDRSSAQCRTSSRLLSIPVRIGGSSSIHRLSRRIGARRCQGQYRPKLHKHRPWGGGHGPGHR